MAIKTLRSWDPFRIMRRWDPVTEMRDMQREMDRMFDRFLGEETSTSRSGFGQWTPMVESYLKGNDLVFKCELPGVDPKDVELSFDENSHQLIIKGERKQEKDTNEADYIYKEFAYGSFERRFSLPESVKTDQLKAKYANGILEITVPAPAVAKAKRIEIEMPKAIEGKKAA